MGWDTMTTISVNSEKKGQYSEPVTGIEPQI